MARSLTHLALSCALIALAAPAAAQQVVGNTSSVVGEVRLSNAAQEELRRIALRQRIAWGDLIQTGGGSQAQILLLDRSTFGIGARSRVRIDRFVYDPDAERSIAASLLQGALRFFSGAQAGNNSAEVTSPSGRIGIRGTAIDMLVGEDAKKIAKDEPAVGDVEARDREATLVVLRGPGVGTSGGLTPGLADVTAAGVTVRLDRPGQAAFIPRLGAPPVGPFMISDAGLIRVQDELAGEVARAADGGLLGDILPVAAGLAVVAVGVIVATDGGDDNGRTADNPNDVPNSTTGGPNSPTSGPNGLGN
ncbi:MAG: FecR family protein [Alteraurantiacibacter sp.]